jgi:hypothetical protein
MHLRPLNADHDELALLERAARYSACRELADLTDAAMRQITRQEGVDFATAVLFDRLCRSRKHELLFDRLNTHRVSKRHPVAADLLFAIVPGALHAEHPETGADGAAIREAVEFAGGRTDLIPLRTMGLPSENGKCLVRWLRDRPPSERIVLISLSKGGTDVKAALADPHVNGAFDQVDAWISVSGVIDGVPMANWGLRRLHTQAIWRAIFWWRGWSFRFVREMKLGARSESSQDLRLPSHMRLIHVVGFPLKRHIRLGYARRWFARLATNGPNDTVSMLLDLCRLPGLVFPIWGADHYLGTHDNSATFVEQLMSFLMDNCDLSCSTSSDSHNHVVTERCRP